jgi:hypothetical protein
MKELQPLYNRYYSQDNGQAIKHALESLDHFSTANSGKATSTEAGGTGQHWPQPDKVKPAVVMETLATKGITSFSEDDLPESPNGSGHSVDRFLRDFFHGADGPIYLGNRYGGLIHSVEAFANKPDLVAKKGYDQMLPNPMVRRLTEEELAETVLDSDGKPVLKNGKVQLKYASGGRCYEFASPTLDVILFESDSLPKEIQLAVIVYLSGFLPLISIVWSTGKSFHAYFSLKGLTRAQVDAVRKEFVTHGGDHTVMNPANLTRLGGVHRSDKGKGLQRVLWMDREARSRSVGLDDLAKFLSGGDSILNELESMIASTPENIVAMEKMARESVFVLPKIAISGQMTLINAAPNVGKTLLTCWLLSQREEEAKESQTIYYINADDDHPGSIEKMKLMREFGVNFLIPGEADFLIEKFRSLLNNAVEQKQAAGITFVLDTLKKFVSMMDKEGARDLCILFRSFIQAGGTIIALAHTNKHKAGDGSSIAEGVGDFMNDFDCAYTIELKSDGGEKTIAFTNTKSRGPNGKMETFTYDNSEKKSWTERFESVARLGEVDALRAFDVIDTESTYEKNRPAIEYICQRLGDGELSRREIAQEGLRNGISRTSREAVLDQYTDANEIIAQRHWTVTKGETGGQIYALGAVVREDDCF